MTTKYWPLSLLASSPLMPQHYAWEITRSLQTCEMSLGCGMACADVALHTPHMNLRGFHIINYVGSGARTLFMEYPTPEEFERVERGFMIEMADGCVFGLVDALH